MWMLSRETLRYKGMLAFKQWLFEEGDSLELPAGYSGRVSALL
jgi:hypothetical protein